MSADAVYLDFEDPSAARPQPPAKARKPKKRPDIPVLPARPPLAVEQIMARPGGRARECVNLRLERVPWHVIVDRLGYASREEAEIDFHRQLRTMHSEEEAETMRALTIANAEQLLARSMAMASADYLVDVDVPEKKIPNRDRLRWHQQASADLNLLATITGVKSPIRVEVTPTEEQYAALTAAVLQARGISPIIEAEVLELEEIPPAPEEES